MMYAIPLKVCSELRPAPGSRVITIPAKHPRGGRVGNGKPAKGPRSEDYRNSCSRSGLNERQRLA